MSLRWNLADLFELVADAVPDRLALAHGEKGRTRSWAELEARANALAAHLVRRHQPGDKLAIYSHNRPEYVEALLAALKARLVPVNVNYRYREDELAYLFDNSDATAVVYEATFAREVAALRGRLAVREWIELQDGAPGNAFAEPYEEIASQRAARLELPRSADDLILLYTGGTTGMPKGVMWQHGALWRALGGGGSAIRGEAPSESPAEHRARVMREENAARMLPGCPLMHGTGQFMTYTVMGSGGAVVTLEGRGLDAHELWRTVEARRVQTLAIVGDAFAKPMLRALEERLGAYDLSCVRHVVSSGVMWSPPDQARPARAPARGRAAGLLRLERSGGLRASRSRRATSSVQLGRFRIGPNCKVFTPEGEEVEPGSGVAGFIARSGPIPAGYYKDEKKSAETFRTLQGRRWSIPGDWCTVNADGTLELLGRGSVCINTGGEKVYPEEVEEALKLHPSVADAVVVGLPDEQWGEAVTGVVELRPGGEASEAALRDFVRQRLAGYKVPKRLVFVDSVGRSPSGKADYKGAKAKALAAAPRGALSSVTFSNPRGTDPLDSALGEVGLRRRFILCDGAELARLWARIGSGESEELTWVPQDEEESRARPAGLPRPPGRALASESILKLDPKEGDDFVVVTEEAPFARAALAAIADALPASPVLLMSDRIAAEEVPPYPCLRHTGLRSLIRDDVERELDHLENLRRVVQLRELLEHREKVAILLQPDPDPDGIAAGYGLRALLGRKSPTAPLVSFGAVTRPENRAMVAALGLEVRTVSVPELEEFEGLVLADVQPPVFGESPPARVLSVDVVIDHHPERPGYDAVLKDIRTSYGATSSIVTEYLEAVGPRAAAEARHRAPLRHQERHAAARPRHEPRRSRGLRLRARRPQPGAAAAHRAAGPAPGGPERPRPGARAHPRRGRHPPARARPRARGRDSPGGGPRPAGRGHRVGDRRRDRRLGPGVLGAQRRLGARGRRGGARGRRGPRRRRRTPLDGQGHRAPQGLPQGPRPRRPGDHPPRPPRGLPQGHPRLSSSSGRFSKGSL